MTHNCVKKCDKVLLWCGGGVTGFCSRFLLEEAQCTSIYQEAAVAQWPSAQEQRDVFGVHVCVLSFTQKPYCDFLALWGNI